ncbi:MAG: hypothetical protein M3P32_04770 [Chloroflexota bacterium]|nr:hypothetical protein [Chloroflexota bacterium]
MAARQVADGPALFSADPTRDELRDQAGLIHDTERRVLGCHELTHTVDDELQDLVDVEKAADPADRGVQCQERRRKARTIWG